MSRGIVQASRAVRFGGALRPTPVVLKQSNPVPSVGIPGPTFSDRTSPAAPPGQAPTHPGYTHESTPITSAHPRDIPGVDGAAPASRVPGASTVAGQPHVEVHTLAEGAKIGGSDAIRPEERNVKNWGPNQRTPEFNELEGKRRPVLDGGSNEGGLGPDGKSRT
ncbi:hypothetical protein IE81DRAFT_327017 [Ceraceosorus guamensis]|uniref:Uncharacterized protein n=1 Tax=Ceraceosorus guamensis TaxID=1522189 RepID=A0A316VMT3_9BASI|nr:hypothetical protein IE81DRAFT_327017 [Ceraceosorus guamensis]PWN38939.1 hypothetical protein IE81DRAFT_327017 [Ceraceosorus guamensis]